MTAQTGDTIIYQGELRTIKGGPCSITREFGNRYDLRYRRASSCNWKGYEAIWELADDKLYLISVNGRAEITDKVQYREEKLRLRKLVRQGEITPQQNGHMLKAYYKEITITREVDEAFIHGSPGPLFAHWVTDILPIPKERKGAGLPFEFISSLKDEYLHLYIEKGKLIKTEPYKYEGELLEDNRSKDSPFKDFLYDV